MPLTDQQKRLVEDSINLARYLTMNWINKGIYDFSYDELMSIFSYALCKAGLTFDPSKGVRFSTYSIKCMQNELKMEFRKHSNRSEHFEDEFLINENNAGEEYDIREYLFDKGGDQSQKIIDRIFLENAFRSLDYREKLILNLRFFQETKQEEISDILGISRSYVSRIEKRGIEKLRKQLNTE